MKPVLSSWLKSVSWIFNRLHYSFPLNLSLLKVRLKDRTKSWDLDKMYNLQIKSNGKNKFHDSFHNWVESVVDLGITWTYRFRTFLASFSPLGISKNDSNSIWTSLKVIQFSKVSDVWLKNWAFQAHFDFELNLPISQLILQLEASPFRFK